MSDSDDNHVGNLPGLRLTGWQSNGIPLDSGSSGGFAECFFACVGGHPIAGEKLHA